MIEALTFPLLLLLPSVRRFSFRTVIARLLAPCYLNLAHPPIGDCNFQTSPASVSEMATKFTLIRELKLGRNDGELRARVSRLWAANIFNKATNRHDEFIGYDILLLDDELKGAPLLLVRLRIKFSCPVFELGSPNKINMIKVSNIMAIDPKTFVEEDAFDADESGQNKCIRYIWR